MYVVLVQLAHVPYSNVGLLLTSGFFVVIWYQRICCAVCVIDTHVYCCVI